MDLNFDISALELKELLEKDSTINLIDVRTPEEYNADNLGGKLMPLGDFLNYVNELEALKGQDIYLQCRSGARSHTAKEILISLGFDKVHNVLGGIMAFRELE